MNCPNCEADNTTDYPLCPTCAATCHFKYRKDCKCDACAAKPKRNDNSIIDWRTLRARKSYLDLRTEDIVAASGCGSRSVCAFLAGEENLNLETIIRLSAALGLRPRITFEVADNVVELKAVA